MNKSVKETNENNNLNNEDNKNNTINNSIFPKNTEEFPFEPYNGEEPYIFASFSHDDNTLVFPILKGLYDEGYNIWYEKNLDTHKELPENIQNKIEDCSVLLVFISGNSVESFNVRNEITFALGRKKPCIPILLDKTELKYGLGLIMALTTSIPKYDLDNDSCIKKVIGLLNQPEVKSKYKSNNYNIPKKYDNSEDKPKNNKNIPKHDTKPMNFKELDELIHSGEKEIKLEHNILLEEGEEKKYLEGILIDVDDIIIDGNEHTIDAQEKTRIFKTMGKNITIKNITIKHGFAHEGGAINNQEGTITIENTILTNNTATGEFSGGGAKTTKMEQST